MSVYPDGVAVKRDAHLSECGTYRYRLTRYWDAAIPLPFIARSLGFGGIGVWNLYAYRTTKPRDLWQAGDPIGPDNDRRLRNLLRWAHLTGTPVVAAWGANAKDDRVRTVLAMEGASNLACLGLTKHGAPRHPLYVPGGASLVGLS